jgi:hypothetical protein
VVLLPISLLLLACPDEISSAGGDKLHPDDISCGVNHCVPYDAGCELLRCEARDITMMVRDDGVRTAFVYKYLSFVTRFLRVSSSQITIYYPGQRPSLALSLSEYFFFPRCRSSARYPHGSLSTPPLRQNTSFNNRDDDFGHRWQVREHLSLGPTQE